MLRRGDRRAADGVPPAGAGSGGRGMASQDNRARVEAWIAAEIARDHEAVRALYAKDIVVTWPQTGERIRGVDDVIEVDRTYPGLPDVTARRIVGSDDRWILDATFTPRRVLGS